MQYIELNKSWDFYEADESMSFIFAKPASEVVDLPHDYIIHKPRTADAAGAGANGYFGQGEGVYRKTLDVPADWINKTVILDIDGAYMNTEVGLNNEILGIHPYGYTPYQVDLTKALRFDGKKNVLKIITQSRQPSTRWYSGGGLYRSVGLWVGGKVYINPWDVFVTTPEVADGRAKVKFSVTVTNKNDDAQMADVYCEILDANGQVSALGKAAVNAVPGHSEACDVVLTVDNPNMWELDNPYLYTYKVQLMNGDTVLDTAQDTFGIRTIAIDVENGFVLNGKSIKLKGGCIHHDNGLLGACAYPKAEERKIRILKSVGYNAVRISHYPPSLAMLRACDALGVLLLDECFDVWRMGKMPMDYHLYFEAWWERDIEYMVKRDRNHPCVITYSIGNEIGERDGSGDGAAWARRLNDKFKSLDPTRFTLSAICGIFDEDDDIGTNFDANAASSEGDKWGDKTEGFASPLDIVGYNYLWSRYEGDHKRWPNRIMMGTETHALTTYDYWDAVMKHSYVLGDFIWAAVDYLGEVGVGKTYWEKDNEPFNFMTPYPWRTSWQSDILLTGRRRPQSYFREIMWEHTTDTWLFTTHPTHYGENCSGTPWRWHDVNDDWSFEDCWVGKMVKVDAYGPGDEAEFLLNGKSMGRAPYEKLIATLDIPYEKGVLEAVSYKDGVEISRGRLISAGPACKLVLTPETPELKADGMDLCYVHVDVTDADGVRLPSDARELSVTLSGPAEFVAFGSGSPCTEDVIGDTKCHAYHGSAVIVFKAGAPEAIRVRVEAAGVADGECVVEALK